MKYFNILHIVILFVFLFSCSSDKSTKKDLREVTIWELSDASMLNLINSTDASAGYIGSNIFQSLLNIDYKTLEFVPVLAENRPKIEKTEDGRMLFTYRIRPEARWDNGEPITAKDVEFTLKVIKNPKVNNQHSRFYYDFIDDIKFYEDDLLKFTFISNMIYILAEAFSSDFPILPAYVYDPNGLMKDFTIKQLNDEKDVLAEDPKIIEFAQEFNSEKYQREPEYVVGSGPYLLEEWLTGQKIVLKRKKNWWGDQIEDKNMFFIAHPPRLIYQTINDQTSAIVALKAGELDVMRSIPAKDFIKFPESKKITDNFVTHTPMRLSYSYIGLNTKKQILSNKITRQALAHLVDVDKIIEIVSYGYGERIVGPIHPSKKKYYNNDIVPYQYNLEKVKELLVQAGWEDSDGNGIIDMEIDGKWHEFVADFIYPSGNDQAKQIALMFQEEARKVGITINVQAKEWSIFLKEIKEHKFDIYIGAWISSPIPTDYKQIFHTDSYNGGSNYTGFGNEDTDALIDSIRMELDGDKRAILNKRFQKILHEEVSYIFLSSGKERIAIHKRFDNAETTIARPGYYEAGFSLKAEFVAQ